MVRKTNKSAGKNHKYSGRINILSVSDDAINDIDDYGNSIVEYEIPEKNFRSFIFSQEPANNYDQDVLISEIETFLAENGDIEGFPHWMDLPLRLRKEILKSEWDMLFIEEDDPDWTEAEVTALYEEVAKWPSLNNVIVPDDAMITFFADCMNCVNWHGCISPFHTDQEIEILN